jgi:hypothetical protein
LFTQFEQHVDSALAVTRIPTIIWGAFVILDHLLFPRCSKASPYSLFVTQIRKAARQWICYPVNLIEQNTTRQTLTSWQWMAKTMINKVPPPVWNFCFHMSR